MIYKLLTKMIVGITYCLNDYKGKVIMLVNTATKCGLSGQFEELEKYYLLTYNTG